MASLKLLSAALFAAAVIAAPAMAREHHASARSVTGDTFVATAPDAGFAGPVSVNGYRCIPAPRVGAFAGAPWDTSVPCQPAPTRRRLTDTFTVIASQMGPRQARSLAMT